MAGPTAWTTVTADQPIRSARSRKSSVVRSCHAAPALALTLNRPPRLFARIVSASAQKQARYARWLAIYAARITRTMAALNIKTEIAP